MLCRSNPKHAVLPFEIIFYCFKITNMSDIFFHLIKTYSMPQKKSTEYWKVTAVVSLYI